MERSRMPEYSTQVLTEDERVQFAEPLKSMVGSVGWPLFVEVLKRYRISARESFELAGSLEDVAYTRGLITGLALAENAPAECLAEAEKTLARDEAKGRTRIYQSQSGPSGDPSF